MTQHSIDLTQAIVVAPHADDHRVRKARDVLVEEVAKRSGVTWSVVAQPPDVTAPLILIGTKAALEVHDGRRLALLEALDTPGREGYRIVAAPGTPVAGVLVAGHDARGVLYGVGRLLRLLEMRPDRVTLPADLRLSSTPYSAIRGHQLGYRAKNNAYDAWNVTQFEQYIRELAIFGANAIEILPPRTDDDPDSELMPLPPDEMMVELSRIIDGYGLDLWVWYPNVGGDYDDPDVVQAEMAERDEVFSRLARLDHIFIPGGDPGHLDPARLFAWSEQVARVAHRHHPQTKIWLSPQAFRPDDAWLDGFYAEVARKPPWLGGVVFGPWVRTPLPELRRRVPAELPVRRYPDITHSLHCQYPVTDWDLAYALTHGREGINPRPQAMKAIHNRFLSEVVGSITYSEGINDDVNKFIWSDQDWDPETPVEETLTDYARLFIDPDHAPALARGLLALEENWQGALLTNSSVAATLRYWEALVADLPAAAQHNYRVMMALLRATYDAYIQRRLLYETELEAEARDALRTAPEVGLETALTRAALALDRANTAPVAAKWRARCIKLADALFDAVGHQTSVPRHKAKAWGRGAFMDAIDLPLNDAPWLLVQFAAIRELPTEPARRAALESLLHRTAPDPGGIYVDFGTSESRRYIVLSEDPDPGFLHAPLAEVNMRGVAYLHLTGEARLDRQPLPLAQIRQLSTRYTAPLTLRFDNLWPVVHTLRVAYSEDTDADRVRVAAGLEPRWELAADVAVPALFQERHYAVPPEAIVAGTLALTWTAPPGARGLSLAEIWLTPVTT